MQLSPSLLSFLIPKLGNFLAKDCVFLEREATMGPALSVLKSLQSRSGESEPLTISSLSELCEVRFCLKPKLVFVGRPGVAVTCHGSQGSAEAGLTVKTTYR